MLQLSATTVRSPFSENQGGEGGGGVACKMSGIFQTEKPANRGARLVIGEGGGREEWIELTSTQNYR